MDLLQELEDKVKDCKNTNSIFNTNKYVLLEDAKEILKQALNIDDVSVSFTDSERTEFVETTIFLNSQNLSGRETEDELYEAGIVDCFDDLIEKINER